MKTPYQAAVCLLAIGTLLSGPAAQATDLAELPLKSSVLARPNVIFGMDDSGSMDWEFLLDTSSGLFWYDGDDGWDSGEGRPRRSKHSSYWGYAYLLPVGTATGGQIYAYNSTNGLALPPTNQFAWVRSAAFNPLYYDTNVTYEPWSPAYHDGAVRTYSNASTSAALSHPAYSSGPTLDVGADWTSSAGNWTSNGYRFYVQAGMVLPIGARVSAESTTANVCNGSGEKTLTAAVTVASGRACWASVPYYPATFWQAENCTVGTNCVLAPDGTTKLKRYEIKSGNTFPSGRSHANELQNFANWFSYYRKRKLMLAGSMGGVLEDLTGLRVGLMKFTDESASTPTVTMYDTDNPNASSNGRRIAGDFYKNALAAEGTPTHATVKHIAKQFNENTAIVQYACQRNNMFIVTDGFSNTTSITPPSWDAGKSDATWGSGTPYQTTATGTLSDLALRYYTNRLRASGDYALAAGKVPASSSTARNADKNTDLHINTYAISLGVRGSLWPNSVDPFDSAPTWTTPVADDPSLIDDQWHATINGRGLMFLATNPAETKAGIRTVLEDIVSQRGAQGGLAVSTRNLVRGDTRAYYGYYNPSGWQGDVVARPIDAATGAVDEATTLWSASSQLLVRDWTTRIIATGGSGFTAADVGGTVNPSAAYGDTSLVINYLRGDRSNESTLFRKRQSLLGAVINSQPEVHRTANVVYVQSGEGMLHAFDTATATAGRELWAFVPPAVLGNIGETVQRSYIFRTQLDGVPTLGTYASGTLLVASMGVAGRSYYALDVSSPRTMTEATLASAYKWQFPAVGDSTTAAKVGQTLGRARIVKTGTDGYVVLVTSGYNNADGRGRLWMLNASTGAVIHEFDTGVGSSSVDAGLSQVAAFAESNGTVRYVYGGDLLGNVWRFDLQGKGTPLKLAVLKDGSNVAQPVTAPPELTMIDGKRVVIVGTGRILDIGDFGSTQTQSLYVIADGSAISNARSTLVEQVYNAGDDSVSGDPVDWASDRGWYVDLPAGEQLNTAPEIAYGAVAVVANKNGGNDCSASARLYVFDAKTGGAFGGTDFVSTEISSTANSSGVTALATSKGRIVGSGQDADGTPWERDIVKNAVITPAKNSWREIRRQ